MLGYLGGLLTHHRWGSRISFPIEQPGGFQRQEGREQSDTAGREEESAVVECENGKLAAILLPKAGEKFGNLPVSYLNH
jgi:hypothetical protein